MLQNYLKIALRNLSRNRFFTLLNFLGLSIGISTGLLILLWVQGEYAKNQYPDAARMFRVNAHLKSGDGVNSWPYTSAAIGPHALREIPELEQAVRVSARKAPIDFHVDNKVVFEKNAAYVDSVFFQFFDLDFIAGDPARPFSAVNSIVLTETTARKFFGDQNPIGKIVQRGDDPKDQFVISGVMRDWPAHSEFDYTYLLNFERVTVAYNASSEGQKYEDTWGAYSMHTFFKLHAPGDMAVAQQKVDDMNRAHNPNPINDAHLSLQPIEQLALQDAAGNDTGGQTLQIFLFAALFILCIACINYINLSTAQATRRAREVGMRKVIGAEKRHLLSQFMLESALLTGAAFGFALLLVQLALPFCNDFWGQKLTLKAGDPAIMRLLFGTFIGILLLSGAYPAAVLAGFKPMQVLKGKLQAASGRTVTLRQGLVVMQFALSILLLVGTMIVGRQLDFILKRDPGFNREHVFTFQLRPGMMAHKAALLADLEQIPGVEFVSQTEFDMLGSANTTSGDWDGKPEDVNVNFYYFNGDHHLDEVLKLSMVEGEWFSGTAADSNKVIVNETAIKTMGINNPLGKRFTLGGGKGVIGGVVRDFNFNSVREKIRPVVFYSAAGDAGLINVRAKAAQLPAVLAGAGAVWKKFEATYPFDYQFLDEDFAELYRSEQRVGALFKVFSGIALLIACLGLFGLAAFMAAQRTKEIGVRKVLGASVAGITGLLARDFLKLVLVAVAIASPVAYYFMQRWLADFAYRVDIQWWMFAGAGAIAVGIAFLTVGGQAVKAALANPMQSLRSE